MTESESPRRANADLGSTTTQMGTTVPGARGDAAPGDGFTLAPHVAPLDQQILHLETSGGESPSSNTRGAVLIDDQKTVISKKPPVAEPVTLQRATSPMEMGRILIGERLGHFDLIEFVGGGGMGAVFRANDTMLNRTVAVKVLSRDQTDEETLKRFKNEAQNAARLDHEKIARVYYVGEDKGWHYIVFEYIDGVNVRDLVDEKGPLAIDEAVNYTLQVTEALRHASRRDVVHRDIKPSNILVLPDGRAKLVDMGLARLHQVESPQDDLTASGVTLGTFDYISPEQARDPRNADVRSDIYSLGCTLYYMLTGRPPFPDGTVLQKLLSHSSDPPPDPRLFRPEIPDEICRILSKMLVKNPAHRYQDPDDLIAELLTVAERLGLDSSTRASAVFLAHPVARAAWYEQHLPWIAPVITLVVVILALDWLGSPSPEAIARPKPNLLPAVASIKPNTNDDTRPSEVPPLRVAPEKPTPATNTGGTNTSANNSTPPAVTVTKPSTTPTKPVASDDQPLEAGVAAPSEGATTKTGNTSENTKSPTDESPAQDPVTTVKTETDPMPRPTPSTTPVVTRVLIVGPANTPHGPQAKVVSTLAAACLAAANMPELEAIELHFDGQRVEQPLDISSSAITIRAASGRTPVLVFRPDIDSVAEDRRMIRIDGGRVTMQGVQLRLELPTDRGGDGWSLLALDEIRSLEMERCVLTIVNSTTSGAALQDDVAFLELLSPPVASRTDQAAPNTNSIPPLVQLFATIARGEATFIRAESGVPFQLNWDQGLLITSSRFADIGGASEAQVWDTWVKIKLKQVTAVMQEGFCLMRSRPEASKHLALGIGADNCIFVTDPSAPFIEHRTQESVESMKSLHPAFRGHSNIYFGPRDFWRVVPERVSDPAEPTFVVSFGKDGANYGFQEPNPGRAVMWAALPAPTQSPHTQFKTDYALSDEAGNPALGSGFDPTLLPDPFGELKTARPVKTEDSAVVPSEKARVEKPLPDSKLPAGKQPDGKTMSTPTLPMPMPVKPSESAASDMKTPDMKSSEMRPPMMREATPATPTMTMPSIMPRD